MFPFDFTRFWFNEQFLWVIQKKKEDEEKKPVIFAKDDKQKRAEKKSHFWVDFNVDPPIFIWGYFIW